MDRTEDNIDASHNPDRVETDIVEDKSNSENNNVDDDNNDNPDPELGNNPAQRAPTAAVAIFRCSYVSIVF